MKENISNLIKAAMLNKDAESLTILRVLKGEIERNEQTAKGRVELTDPDIVNLVKKLLQSVKESGGTDKEITILESFLPKQLTEAELKGLVVEYVSANNLTAKDMGNIMAHFKQTYNGQYDGKTLSVIVKELA
jgi:uncharacterized protein YqeY